jgi:hypothetical protein
MAQKSNKLYSNLAELHAMVAENRVLTSDVMMRKGLQEAFQVLNSQRGSKNKQDLEAIKSYMQEYNDNLNNESLLCAMQGAEAQQWPISVVARNVDNAADMDIMCLSSMLNVGHNMQLCGNFAAQTRLLDSNIFFNANAMNNPFFNAPNVIFGTGVAGAVISAWNMAPSVMEQTPITMQISIPAALLVEKAESLDLHFLVAKQGGSHHKARVAVDVKYMAQYGEFNIFDAHPTYTYHSESHDFDVYEPIAADDVRHVCVSVPLQKTSINKCNFIIISVTRATPAIGELLEYDQSLYLASAVLRYMTL